MAVRSEDIAEPTLLTESRFGYCLKASQAAHAGAALLGLLSEMFQVAADGKVVLLAICPTDEQAEVVRMMVQSAKEALDLRNQVETVIAGVGTVIQQSKGEPNDNNG